jgi:hypothetical protein
MDLKEFRHKFHVHIYKDHPHESRIKELKHSLRHVDYDCDFEDGVCVRVRNVKDEGRFVDPKGFWGCGCCCSMCAKSGGYFSNMFETDAKKIVKQFRKTTGFWRKGVGCVLPHSLRSITCLNYKCMLEPDDQNYKLINHILKVVNSLKWRKEGC